MQWQEAHERLRIAVLAGGDSHEREVSLASGRCVEAGLAEAGYDVEPFDTLRTDISRVPWKRFDAAFLALHGGAGEDGRIQRRLELLDVPYTGSGPLASQLAMCKSISKQRFHASGVPTTPFVLLDGYAPAERARAKLDALPYPLVLKPDSQGSSLGVSLVRTPEDVEAALHNARRWDPFVLAEPRIEGREFTVALLGRRPLPVLEIVTSHDCFDYSAKYEDAGTEYRFDTGLSKSELRRLEDIAVAAAAALGTSGLVRADMMVDREGQPWVLEVNTVPGLTDKSLAPKAAARAGMSFPELTDWMVKDCLEAGISYPHDRASAPRRASLNRPAPRKKAS